MPELSIYAVVLTWNGREDTLRCLASLQDIEPKGVHLLVVDNGSTDGTAEAIAERYPHVEVLVNERDLGFAAGCNVGMRYAINEGADYVFLLSNDTVAAPDTLRHLLDAALTTGAGMLAPKIYYMADPTRIWSVGAHRNPITLEISGDGRGQHDTGQWNSVLERDFLTGCVLLLSRRFLAEVGLFDERFFLYYDDSDLSLRARQAGEKLLLVPQAHIWHKVALSSGGSDSPTERYWMARSNVLFLHKHVRGPRWLVVVPYRAGSALKTLGRLLLRRRYRSAGAYLRGLRDGLLQLRAAG
jgi:GT2 family glycosyltransferase